MRCYALNEENNTNWAKEPNKAHNVAKNGTKKAPAKPLTPQMEERKRRALALRRQKRETFFARLILCAAIYFAVCLIIAIFVFSLYRGSIVGDNAADIVVADKDGKAVYELEADRANINGVEYISASALSSLYKFTLAGDKNEVTLHFHNLKQSISLFKDSAVVEMNGENIRLGAKIIFTNDYYIPLELIENYFNGAIIERDGDKGVITLSQNNEVDFYLRLQKPQLTTPA